MSAVGKRLTYGYIYERSPIPGYGCVIIFYPNFGPFGMIFWGVSFDLIHVFHFFSFKGANKKCKTQTYFPPLMRDPRLTSYSFWVEAKIATNPRNRDKSSQITLSPGNNTSKISNNNNNKK